MSRPRRAATRPPLLLQLSDSEEEAKSEPEDAFSPPSAPSEDAFSLSAAPSSPEIEEIIISSDDEPRGVKRKRTASRPRAANGRNKGADVVDIEDCIARPHARSYHSTKDVAEVQQALLDWFDNVRDKRGMPWRKRYDPSSSKEAKAQRAYEVWVSEVMLQQTQVATVIDYWTRWIARWPTIRDLAKADIEDVNAAWRGLGYYRRAKSLLEGAKVVVAKFDGALPSDPELLESAVPGVGRYTAGAIASIAYGIRTPLVDGNVHRVLTRLLGLHANQVAGDTTRFLWDAATALVDSLPRGLSRGVAGDWNQALMELGATICRPAAAECGSCPLREACKAYAELSAPPPPPDSEECTLCLPMPGTGELIPSVAVFPMRKVRKESRVEHEVVCVLEWRNAEERRWLLVKRPETGLLAGLFEPPSAPVPVGSDTEARAAAAVEAVQSAIAYDGELLPQTRGEVSHIFSHINMTYHVVHAVISVPDLPSVKDPRAGWYAPDQVAEANIGTGVKKVWAAVYGAWGKFDDKAGKSVKVKAAKKPRTVKVVKAKVAVTEKIVKTVRMPGMPVKAE